MATRRVKNESFENMRSVVKNAQDLETKVTLDNVTADACIQHEAVEQKLADIQTELNKKVEGLVPETEEVKNPVENTYTAPLKLDESFSNFKLNEDYFDTDEYRVTRYQDDIAECLEWITDRLEELENKYNEGKFTPKAYADKLSKIYDYLTHNILTKQLVECDEQISEECGDKFQLDECDEVITEADGRSHRVSAEDNEPPEKQKLDKYLDFDMADFLMCLVSDGDDMNPKIPAGIKFKKFINSVDDYNDNISGKYTLLIGNDAVGTLRVDLSRSQVTRSFDNGPEHTYKIVKNENGILHLDRGARLICDAADPNAPATEFIDKINNYEIRKLNSLNRAPQTGVSDSGVTVYGDNVERFDSLIAICNEWKLEYKGPIASKSKEAYWKYYLDVKIPVDESGLPMLVEDYFAQVFPEEADTVMYRVMPTLFAKAYYNQKKKLNKEKESAQTDVAVRKALKSAITAASLDGSRPLTDFLDDMYAQLDGLNYDKKKITKEFMDAFADDEPEEDDE